MVVIQRTLFSQRLELRSFWSSGSRAGVDIAVSARLRMEVATL